MKTDSMSLTNNHIDRKITDCLKQGSKVEFKFHGSDTVFTGRIEIDEAGEKFFVNEHNYQGEKLTREGMRYYCPLNTITFSAYFKVL